MAPSGTPSPFRSPSSARRQQRRPPVGPSSNSTNGPQFASTPRFILSQRSAETVIEKKDEIDDSIDADASITEGLHPFSTPVPTARPTTNTSSRTRATPRQILWNGQKPREQKKETIEDSGDEEEYLGDVRLRTRHQTQDGDDDVVADDESPISDAVEAGSDSEPHPAELSDEEWDILFGSPRERSKRRRIAVEGGDNGRQMRRWAETSKTEKILTSSPMMMMEEDGRDGHAQLASSPEIVEEIGASKMAAAKPSILIGTPGPVNNNTPRNFKPPFREPPRFVLSASRLPAEFPSQNPQVPPPSPATVTGSRKKPHFILPRSPSPSHGMDYDDTTSIPVPFSPSSHTLQRKGRARNSTPAYLPGGMAAEVRAWILEMGAQRPPVRHEGNPYYMTAHVAQARETTLSSSGGVPCPLTFMRVSQTKLSMPTLQIPSSRARTDRPTNAEIPANLLLFGKSQTDSKREIKAHESASDPRRAARRTDTRGSMAGADSVERNGLIGIHNGLVWEMELDRSCSEQEQSSHLTMKNQRWLVAMEWDLLAQESLNNDRWGGDSLMGMS